MVSVGGVGELSVRGIFWRLWGETMDGIHWSFFGDIATGGVASLEGGGVKTLWCAGCATQSSVGPDMSPKTA